MMAMTKWTVAFSAAFLAFTGCVSSNDVFDYNSSGSDWTGTCASGTSQSPLNVPAAAGLEAAAAGEGELVLRNYSNPITGFNLTDNGHTTVMVPTYAAGTSMPSVSVNGTADNFELLQFHFHTPGEHTFADNANDNYPLEVHLVHANAEERLVVLGFAFKAGDVNPFLTDILTDGLPISLGKTNVDCTKMESGSCGGLNQLLPGDVHFTRYSGSLTTPPCSEDVTWFVSQQILSAAAAQIGTFTTAYVNGGIGNNRVTTASQNAGVTNYNDVHATLQEDFSSALKPNVVLLAACLAAFMAQRW